MFNSEDDELKKDGFLNKIDERKELQEETKYRKQLAIKKLKKVLESNDIIGCYNASNLNAMQRMVILQLMRRIYECEENIPKSMWCKTCKSKKERIFELIQRFQKMYKKSEYYGKSYF